MSEPGRVVVMVLEGTFPPRGGGGAESQVLTLGHSLQARGVAIRVVAPRVRGGPQSVRETVEGLDVLRIPYPRLRLVGGLVMLARLGVHLWRERHRYSVIHAHIAHNMAPVCALVGGLLGKPVIVKLTGSREMWGGVLDGRPSVLNRLRRAALRRATLLQATSTRIRQLLVDRGFDKGRIVFLPNGVDVERFGAASPDAALRRGKSGAPRLAAVYVGRLSTEKGQELLLEAWADAFAARRDVELVLVGDGPLRATLEALARHRGIEGQVTFAGHTTEVAGFLAAADVALLPSLAEGLSNALLEYMAAGLPVIGSRVSGTEDFVVHGTTGWLFEPGDRAGLARCLAEASQAAPGALAEKGKAGRDLVLRTASVDAVTSRLMECYGFESAGGPPRG